MEMSRGNSPCSYLKETKMSFWFTKQRTGRQNWGVGTSVRGQDIRKGYWSVNMVEILCLQECKWKNDTC
jgi:hypothetical protein